MTDERTIGGVTCREVLAELSAYLDGELAAPRRDAIEVHVRGCDLCTRFGGVFSTTVAALRARLGGDRTPLAADEPRPDVAQRLAESLRRARG